MPAPRAPAPNSTQSAPTSPVAATAGGVRLKVRVTPRARVARIGGVELNDAGEAALKVYVTAAPEDGKANAALIKLLAKAWHLPKTSIEIAAGLTDRRKTLHIEGDAGALLRAIAHRLSIGGSGSHER